MTIEHPSETQELIMEFAPCECLRRYFRDLFLESIVSGTDGVKMICVQAIQELTVICNVSAENWQKLLYCQMGRYNKYETNKAVHARTHTSTLHTQHMVAGTVLGDHQGRPSVPLMRCVKPSKFILTITDKNWNNPTCY